MKKPAGGAPRRAFPIDPAVAGSLALGFIALAVALVLLAARAAAARLFIGVGTGLLVGIVLVALAAGFHMLLVAAALVAGTGTGAGRAAARALRTGLFVALAGFLIRVHHDSFEKMEKVTLRITPAKGNATSEQNPFPLIATFPVTQ